MVPMMLLNEVAEPVPKSRGNVCIPTSPTGKKVDGEELVLTCEDEAWEKIVVRRLTGRPWWWMLAPAIAGLLIAFGLFSALG